MKTMAFTIDAPAMIKEIATQFNQVGHAGILMGLTMILGGLAEIAIQAHTINDREIIRILNSMGITREYLGELAPPETS